MNLLIRSFSPDDQASVRTLILAGLADHWGDIDPSLNPDVADIAGSYAGETFLVACKDEEIVGCGALVRRDNITGEIVRMSVRKDLRGKGLGRAVLAALCADARRRGFRRLTLETTAHWHGVRAFYEACGFTFTHFIDDEFGGQAHYEFPL